MTTCWEDLHGLCLPWADPVDFVFCVGDDRTDEDMFQVLKVCRAEAARAVLTHPLPTPPSHGGALALPIPSPEHACLDILMSERGGQAASEATFILPAAVASTSAVADKEQLPSGPERILPDNGAVDPRR
jgi:hypothetical protein